MRRVLAIGLLCGAFGGVAASAEDLRPAAPAVLTVVPRSQAPPGATAPGRDLVVQALGASGSLTLWLEASASDQGLHLRVVWDDSDEDRAAAGQAADLGDGLRATFATGLDAAGQPSGIDAAQALSFTARHDTAGTEPVGIWSAGRWHVALQRPCPAGPETLVRFEVLEGGGARWLSPWVRLLVGGAALRRDFEQGVLGQGDPAMRAALGGSGAPPIWLLREHDGQHCLVQESADDTDSHFPLALAEGLEAKDVDLSVRFKALDGFKDRAAGLVWRVKDAGNHYILRANALEKNVVLFKMQDNLRVDLPPVGHEADYGVKTRFDPALWHVLRVVAVGERFQAYLDGQLLFEVLDKTFTEAGGVGLWTKSDSVTAFDDLLAVSLDAPAAAPAATR